MVVLRHLLMLGIDVAWWIVSMRLIKARPWRVLATVFLAAQMTSLCLLLAGFEWCQNLTPKGLLVAVVTWHYFGAALLALIGVARASIWVFRRLRDSRQNCPPEASVAPDGMTRRDFIGVSTALVPPLFNIGLTAVSLAQLNEFRVRRFTLPIPELPRALDGVTIAHLSDIHVGPWTNGRVLRKMVETTNSLRADLVVLTGDLIHYDLVDLSEGISLVKSMEGRHGLWMIEGNHDMFLDGGEFEQRVKAAGVPLLVDESAVAEVRGWPVQLFGLRWINAGSGDNPGNDNRLARLQLRQLLKRRHPDTFPLLLAHHPHVFDVAAEANLPLMLAGHTHGGQWMLDSHRGVGPVLFRYWSGLYKRGGSQMIVSNGVGNVIPPRINAPAEIVHIVLRCA